MFRKNNFILHYRSKIIHNIRKFFLKLNILEIETPSLTQYTVTDYNLIPFEVCKNHVFNKFHNKSWLITSPEYHMKRLLSYDIGPIYQICHVFRNGEIGNLHNIEFTMLEWYHPFYNMFDMMEIIEKFLINLFLVKNCDRISYRNIFIKKLNIDPIHIDLKKLYSIITKLNHQHLIKSNNNIIDLLNLIFLIVIQPTLGLKKPIFVYHYPANQAMLARINKNNINISDRFELFFKGIELGNGFCELINAKEQKKRFDLDNMYKKNNVKRMIDMRFINALNSKYMPTCSGVALGIDRIIMVICNIKKISQVLSFSIKDC